MRALSFILAIAFVLAAPALEVSAAQDHLPAVGSFSYSGSPVAASVVTLAAR